MDPIPKVFPEVRSVSWEASQLRYADARGGDPVQDQLTSAYPPPVLNLVNWRDVHRSMYRGRMAEELRGVSEAVRDVFIRCSNPPCQHGATLVEDEPVGNEGVRCHAEGCTSRQKLWLCLSCGHVGCCRAEGGGNGHALVHHLQHPGHCLSVKLGTITPHDADVHCYSCRTEAQDVFLHNHLARLGIDRRLQHRTAWHKGMWRFLLVPFEFEPTPQTLPSAPSAAAPPTLRPAGRRVDALDFELLAAIFAWVGVPQEVLRRCSSVCRSFRAGTARFFDCYAAGLDLTRLDGDVLGLPRCGFEAVDEEAEPGWRRPAVKGHSIRTLKLGAIFAIPAWLTVRNITSVIIEGDAFALQGIVALLPRHLPHVEQLSIRGSRTELTDVTLGALPATLRTFCARDMVLRTDLEYLFSACTELEGLSLQIDHGHSPPDLVTLLAGKVPKLKTIELACWDYVAAAADVPAPKFAPFKGLERLVCRLGIHLSDLREIDAAGFPALSLLAVDTDTDPEESLALLHRLPELRASFSPPTLWKMTALAGAPTGRLLRPAAFRDYCDRLFFPSRPQWEHAPAPKDRPSLVIADDAAVPHHHSCQKPSGKQQQQQQKKQQQQQQQKKKKVVVLGGQAAFS
ncbi:Ubiquitin carboxyl-terminal hydrolase A [Diplonema papillatum]|nr:Ubiquitin carboxyl-terminal hydrolase A [Diplonema papillatum]